MFEINSKKIDLWKQNISKSKNISLNKDLDFFIVINSDNEKFIDLTIRNILDYIIDKVSIENTYKEFSIALENINSFIKTWKLDSQDDTKIDIDSNEDGVNDGKGSRLQIKQLFGIGITYKF
jgi:hypothetical protein